MVQNALLLTYLQRRFLDYCIDRCFDWKRRPRKLRQESGRLPMLLHSCHDDPRSYLEMGSWWYSCLMLQAQMRLDWRLYSGIWIPIQSWQTYEHNPLDPVRCHWSPMRMLLALHSSPLPLCYLRKERLKLVKIVKTYRGSLTKIDARIFQRSKTTKTT